MAQSYPKISIVTATFNSASTIRDTLESILNQTYPNYEVIIEDGLSKDNTIQVVNEYKPLFGERLKIFSEKDSGIYDAMNKGLSHTSGDVVGILNSDDFYYDNSVLEKIAKAFQDDSTLSCVYGDLVFVKEHDTDTVVRTWKGSPYPKKGFRSGWHPAHPTFYAKKECFEKYGDFDTSLYVCADFDLMMRFLEKHNEKNQYLPFNFIKMRLGGESTASIKNIIKANRHIYRSFNNNDIKVSRFYFVKRLVPKVWNSFKTRLGIIN